MAFDKEFLELMQQEVQWRPTIKGPNGEPVRNLYGQEDRSDGRVRSVRCLIESKGRKVRGPDGSEKYSSTTLYLAGYYKVGLDDEFELPDGKKPPVAAVTVLYDEDGPYSEVVSLV